MSVPFSFGPSFQESMLALMLRDVSFADRCVRYVEAEYLHSDTHKWLFNQIEEKYRREGMVPEYVEIEDALKLEEKHKRRLFKSFAKKIYALSPGSMDFLKEQLTDFAKRTAFAELFQHGQTLYNAGEVDDAYTYVLEKINALHGVSFHDDQILAIEDFEAFRQQFMAQRAISHDKIPTGIPALDRILLGGLSRLEGEMGCIIAPPKLGKSTALTHMGFMCLTTLSGHVGHVILEGSTEQSVIRYQSRLSGIPAKRIMTGKLTAEEERRLDMLGKRYMNRLHMIPFNQHWEYSTADLEGKVTELKRKGRKLDMLVVDYADLLKPREAVGDPRHDQREVFRDLKRLSYMQKHATWTASQSTRPKDDPEKETLLRARSVAESYDKVRIVDFIMTLNQTPREKRTGIMRAHADLYRSNECDLTLRLVTDFSRMIFYTRRYGYKLHHELPEWLKRKGGKKR